MGPAPPATPPGQRPRAAERRVGLVAAPAALLEPPAALRPRRSQARCPTPPLRQVQAGARPSTPDPTALRKNAGYAPGYPPSYSQAYAPPYAQPYTQPYPYATQIPYGPPVGMPPIVPPGVPIMQPSSRFPAGAIWLIGLGTLFLLGTTGIFHGFSGGALLGFVLIGLGVWVFVRRMTDSGMTLADDGSPGYQYRLLRALRGAVWLLALGMLILLDTFGWVRWHYSWPWLIILAGIMMLLNRAIFQQPPVYPAYAPPSAAEPAVPTTAAAAAAPAVVPAQPAEPTGPEPHQGGN